MTKGEETKLADQEEKVYLIDSLVSVDNFTDLAQSSY